MPARISRAILARYSKLTQKKFRTSEGLFVVEGNRSVSEALSSGWPLEALIVTAEFAGRPEFVALEAMAARAGIPCHVAAGKEIARIADTVTPQGVAAVARVGPTDADPLRSAGPGAVAVALEGVSDPGNLGTIIRTCDWFGAAALIVGGTSVEPYNPKVVRSAMGSLFRVPVIIEDRLAGRLAALRSSGWRICAAVAGGGSKPPRLSGDRLILVFGSEAHGLSTEIRAAADVEVTIPRFGSAESLNVAVACGTMLGLVRLGGAEDPGV